MRRIGIFEAKTNLSRLVEEVEKGREVVITRHGKPVARLVGAGAQRHTPEAVEQRRRAITELREMARKRGSRVSHRQIKAWIEEGRH
jgi:prevent-host-death family protein